MSFPDFEVLKVVGAPEMSQQPLASTSDSQ